MQFQSLLAHVFALVAFATAAPTAPVFQEPAPFELIAVSPSTTDPLSKRNIGGVRLSDGVNFTGHVWYGIFPLDQCINLGAYSGNILSFRPDEDTECLLMQGACDADQEYADLYNEDQHLGDLSYYPYYKNLTSYTCFEVTPTAGT